MRVFLYSMIANQLRLDEILLLVPQLTEVYKEEAEFRKGSDKKVITYRGRYQDLFLTLLSHPYPGYHCMYELSVFLSTEKVAEYILYDNGQPHEILQISQLLESKYIPHENSGALSRAREIIKQYI